MEQGPATSVHHVDVTPMHNRHYDRVKIQPPFGQDVFIPLGPRLVRDAAEHAIADQLFQSIRQNVTSYLEPRLKILKAADPQEAIAQDQKGPTVPNHRDRA